MSIELDIEDGERAIRLILAEPARIIDVLRPALVFGGAREALSRERINHYSRIIRYGALAMQSLPDDEEARVMALGAHIDAIGALDTGAACGRGCVARHNPQPPRPIVTGVRRPPASANALGRLRRRSSSA